jgi:hypothetical protein
MLRVDFEKHDCFIFINDLSKKYWAVKLNYFILFDYKALSLSASAFLYAHFRSALLNGAEHLHSFDFIHFWSVTVVSTIKTTSFTPPSVIKLHLLFAHSFTCFGFLVNHLQKAHQFLKETTIT